MLPTPNAKAVDRRARLQLPEVPTPRDSPATRLAGFGESWQPITLEWARGAARRCIQCPAAPCVKACPAGNDIPYALWQLEHGRVEDAAEVFRRTNPLAAICGRICPQSELCEGACVYTRQDRAPVPIGRLESFVSDEIGAIAPRIAAAWDRNRASRVAIVGAGPAGITAAERLAELGHGVTLYDAWPEPGGLLLYGIPSFKLSPQLVRARTAALASLGVEFRAATRVGARPSIDDLIAEGSDAILLAVGAGVARPLSVEGASLQGVYQASPFLVHTNTPPELLPPDWAEPVPVGERVAVIGGGDTAMDCVRTALRLGAADATVWYRRTEAEMPGNPRDRTLAREEGARFEWLWSPVGLIGDDRGRVRSLRLVRMQLAEPDRSGRRRPVPLDGSEREVAVDTVILALGYLPDSPLTTGIPGLDTEPDGRIRVDPETGATSRAGIFAAGDDVLGPALVVDAVAHGTRAANAMHAFLATGGTAAVT